MKRERVSDSEDSDAQDNNSMTSADATAQHGIYNPGYSFVRPPVAKTKPNPKRPRVHSGNTTTNNVPVKLEPEAERFGELSIKSEAEEDLYGLEPGIKPSRRNNIQAVQTATKNTSNLPDVQTPAHNSKVPEVQSQANVQHASENDTPVFTEDVPPGDENSTLSVIKEKLHDGILGLTSDEPAPSENPPPWGKHFALLGPCPKLINPAITIYGLGGIGLPLSERDAGFIAKFNRPAPDPHTKMSNDVVDLTTIRITELSPDQLETTNPGWEKSVEAVVAKVTKKLKVPGGPANVGFLPRSLTLYGPGDMLREHRGSKRGRGVFGTLAICLPSKHEGGDLIVTHDDQVKVLSTAPRSAFDYQYLFWYTDMTCELTEVASGNRLVLMYDLIDLDSRDKKNNHSELSTNAKFLAYTLDNMYDGQSLSHTVLKGDDIQRVNVLSELSLKHSFSLCLAKLELRVRRESDEGPTEEFFELQDVVELDGTTVIGMVPWSESQVVQNNLSSVFNTENASGFIGDGEGGIVQAVILVLDAYALDLFYEGVKSSATRLSSWICEMNKFAARVSPNGNTSGKVDLKRACQLVIKDVRHWYSTEGSASNNSEKNTCDIDDLLGEVIHSSIFLNDQMLCGEALSLVRSDLPMPEVADAFRCFGFSGLQHKLDEALCSFKHIYRVFRAFTDLYDHYKESKDWTAKAELVTWMKPLAEKQLASRELRFKKDGEAIANVGIICGGKYFRERLMPAVRSDIKKTPLLHPGRSAAVIKFLAAVTEGYNDRHNCHGTSRHVIHCILQVYIPRIRVVDIHGGTENGKKDILVRPCQITRIFRQCVSLELKVPIDSLFDKLDRLLVISPSPIAFEGFFQPLIEEFDEMLPGQTPGTIAEEFHRKAHQFAGYFRKEHAHRFSQPQHKTLPQGKTPQHKNGRPQLPRLVDLPDEEIGCTCKDCLKFTAFAENPAAKSVKFAFGTEIRIAHYKTYQLPLVTKGGFKHTCTITPTENSVVDSYDITVRKTKAQLAMSTQKGNGCRDETDTAKAPTPKKQKIGTK